MLYFPRVEFDLALLCYIFRVWNALWRYCVIFYARGTRYGVIVLYFPRVERVWSYCIIFSARGMRSGVIVLYFPLVERAIALLCYIFYVWNMLWRY